MLLEMKGITKSFPGVQALIDVDFHLAEGEIVSLLGENGAGKSTLMNILYGSLQADEGEILFRGEQVNFKHPSDAIANGIGMIHQHFMLVQNFTVIENIISAFEPCKGIFLDRQKAKNEVCSLIKKFGFNLNAEDRVADLSVGQQQKVEILKALYRHSDLLIMDEPTAVLTPQETEELFEILSDLRNDGKSIILITHKLHESMTLSDRITVLRDGRVSQPSIVPAATNLHNLSEMMVGRQIDLHHYEKIRHFGNTQFSVENLTLARDGKTILDDINFEVKAGEILGFAGVEGNGQSELLACTTGLEQPDSMCLRIKGDEVSGTVSDFLKASLAHIPEDRTSMGLVGEMSISQNLVLGYHHKSCNCRHGIMDWKSINTECKKLKDDFLIKAPTVDTQVRTLSGGNQQKVLIARVFSQHPKVLVIAQPTRGIDIGAAEYIHNKLLKLRDEGTAVLLVSADLEEVLSLSDRVAVIYEGKIIDIVDPLDYSEAEIGLMMAGQKLAKKGNVQSEKKLVK